MQNTSINAHIESISDQLCKAANGDFGFIVESHCDEEVIQKLTILLNFILSVADRSLKELSDEIDERKKLESKNSDLNNQLILAARRAGMADIATNILHNAGNVLNSVITSSTMIQRLIDQSKISRLTDVAQMLESNLNDIVNFFKNTTQGQRLPNYLIKMAQSWDLDKVQLKNEIYTLNKGINHLKEIISKQNNLSRNLGFIEELAATDLIKDALLLNKALYDPDEITITQDFRFLDKVKIDRVKILQVIVNLIKNSIESVTACHNSFKKIDLILDYAENNEFIFQIIDNGCGIAAENLSKLFSQGFTTKKDGHGFGLHASALAIKEMGGTFSATSDGIDQGAVFSIMLPCSPPEIQKKDEYIA